MTFAERHMLSKQQLLQQQTIVMDAGPLVTDDVTEPACNHRAPPRPIITRTVATPLPTPRGSPAAVAAAAGTDDVSGDNSSESFVTSLAGYSDTLSYEASDLSPCCHLPSVRRQRSPALVSYLFIYAPHIECPITRCSQSHPMIQTVLLTWKVIQSSKLVEINTPKM